MDRRGVLAKNTHKLRSAVLDAYLQGSRDSRAGTHEIGEPKKCVLILLRMHVGDGGGCYDGSDAMTADLTGGGFYILMAIDCFLLWLSLSLWGHAERRLPVFSS